MKLHQHHMIFGLTLALSACSTEWHDSPETFVHDGQTWSMQRVRLEITGIWLDAPPSLVDAQMRYHATRAIEAYAGCKIAPASISILPNGANAQMTC